MIEAERRPSATAGVLGEAVDPIPEVSYQDTVAEIRARVGTAVELVRVALLNLDHLSTAVREMELSGLDDQPPALAVPDHYQWQWWFGGWVPLTEYEEALLFALGEHVDDEDVVRLGVEEVRGLAHVSRPRLRALLDGLASWQPITPDYARPPLIARQNGARGRVDIALLGVPEDPEDGAVS